MTQSQKEFEAWCNSDATFRSPEWLEHEQCYNYTSTQMMWKAWQASRAALVVELSALPEASYNTTGTCYVSHVENALDKAGITYK